MSIGLLITVIVVALAFTYINGFHDTANSIATVVATKVLSPSQAVTMAALTNLIGALWGTAVAKTIAAGLIDVTFIIDGGMFLLAALLGACIWNLITWWWGLPSSSSHALVGGLVGSALALSHGNWQAVIWWVPDEQHFWQAQGVIPKVVLPMVASPLLGFALCYVVMIGLYWLFMKLSQREDGILRRMGRTSFVNNFFGKAQIASAAAMGLSHGMNDAQKNMGIIALALAGATAAGALDHLPHWLHFLQIDETPSGDFDIPLWVVVLSALTMAAGTAGGGWRIIKTLGHKMVKLHPINGFAAETGSAAVIIGASMIGIPVSTTHCVSAAIMGVGAAKRFSAIRWTLVERMVWAWVCTLPITAIIAWLVAQGLLVFM